MYLAIHCRIDVPFYALFDKWILWVSFNKLGIGYYFLLCSCFRSFSVVLVLMWAIHHSMGWVELCNWELSLSLSLMTVYKLVRAQSSVICSLTRATFFSPFVAIGASSCRYLNGAYVNNKPSPNSFFIGIGWKLKQVKQRKPRLSHISKILSIHSFQVLVAPR